MTEPISFRSRAPSTNELRNGQSPHCRHQPGRLARLRARRLRGLDLLQRRHRGWPISPAGAGGSTGRITKHAGGRRLQWRWHHRRRLPGLRVDRVGGRRTTAPAPSVAPWRPRPTPSNSPFWLSALPMAGGDALIVTHSDNTLEVLPPSSAGPLAPRRATSSLSGGGADRQGGCESRRISRSDRGFRKQRCRHPHQQGGRDVCTRGQPLNSGVRVPTRCSG